jgi:hypothetical protein
LRLFDARTKTAADTALDPAERVAKIAGIDKKLAVLEILADNGGAMPKSLGTRPECRHPVRQIGFPSKGDSTPG